MKLLDPSWIYGPEEEEPEISQDDYDDLAYEDDNAWVEALDLYERELFQDY